MNLDRYFQLFMEMDPLGCWWGDPPKKLAKLRVETIWAQNIVIDFLTELDHSEKINFGQMHTSYLSLFLHNRNLRPENFTLESA